MADHNYSSSHHLMYYSHPSSQPDNTMNQILPTAASTPSTDTYYAHSLPGSTPLSMIPTSSDMKPINTNTIQQLPLSLISNPPPLVASGQVYDPHQHAHHSQDLGALQDTSLYSDPSSVVDEDVSSRASSSMSGNRTGQEAYIMQLQKQLEESKHLQTQYYYRIEQLMALVEKQTARISELQEQLTHGGYQGSSSTMINGVQHTSLPQQDPQEHHHHHQQFHPHH